MTGWSATSTSKRYSASAPNPLGGQRRRLELARTLATKPQIVLLDEPFAGVDPIAIDMLRGAIRSIQSSGYGVLITDHNVRETLSLVEHVVLIDQGEVLVEGYPMP